MKNKYLELGWSYILGKHFEQTAKAINKNVPELRKAYFTFIKAHFKLPTQPMYYYVNTGDNFYIIDAETFQILDKWTAHKEMRVIDFVNIYHSVGILDDKMESEISSEKSTDYKD